MNRGVQEACEAFQDMAGEVIFHQSFLVMSCSSCSCCGNAWVSSTSGSVWVQLGLQPSVELAVEALI